MALIQIIDDDNKVLELDYDNNDDVTIDPNIINQDNKFINLREINSLLL